MGSKVRKKHVGAKIPIMFVEACRDAAWWAGRGWTLNRILESGATEELERLEAHNGGPFPPHNQQGQLKRLSGTPHQGGPKDAICFLMEPDVLERLRNASVALGVPYTGIIISGASRVLANLRDEFNRGKEFPPREREL